MATEDQIARVLTSLEDIQACRLCETRLRFGDIECPHCGADIDDILRAWAERVVDLVAGASKPYLRPT